MLKRPKLFWKALDEAQKWLEVKKNKSNSGCLSAVASRAASLAAAENKKPRCGNCEACLNRISGASNFSRRCLYVRAQAAAAAGHVGAQVAIHREKAIGAKLEVYWPLEQKWFAGIVTGFDLLRLRHTVLYEDGDREIIALWSPCQLVRVLNKPKDWPEVAREIELQQQEQKPVKSAQKETQVMHPVEMTDYEANRQETIQKNKELLSSVLEQGIDERLHVKEMSLSKLIHMNTTPETIREDKEAEAEIIEPVLQDREQENEKLLDGVDVYAMMEFGGPCRHTRSARRELSEFLCDEKSDHNLTPHSKRPKLDEFSDSHFASR